MYFFLLFVDGCCGFNSKKVGGCERAWGRGGESVLKERGWSKGEVCFVGRVDEVVVV